MAATLTITSHQSEFGPMQGNGPGKVRETLKVVGSSSSANDTGTVKPVHVHKDAIPLDSNFTLTESVTIAGTELTITALVALGSNTVYLDIEGSY